MSSWRPVTSNILLWLISGPRLLNTCTNDLDDRSAPLFTHYTKHPRLHITQNLKEFLIHKMVMFIQKDPDNKEKWKTGFSWNSAKGIYLLQFGWKNPRHKNRQRVDQLQISLSEKAFADSNLNISQQCILRAKTDTFLEWVGKNVARRFRDLSETSLFSLSAPLHWARLSVSMSLLLIVRLRVRLFSLNIMGLSFLL